MDELWQRYRTFWTPVLIGLGVFLVGVIAVHVLSDDPVRAKARLTKTENQVGRMKAPARRKISLVKERGEALRRDVLGAEDSAGDARVRGWGLRLNETGVESRDVIGAAAEQALRAAILRGAAEDIARSPQQLKARFEDDDVAAGKAYKRFRHLVEQHRETLRTGDPNVAWSKLLSDVWTDLRVRANRADVAIGPIAEQLGFGTISSVSRATLTARVLNLALVARLVDLAIRERAESIDAILVPTNIVPGRPGNFLVLWPIEMTLVADDVAVQRLLQMLTEPEHPVPLDYARLSQPKTGGTARRPGLVQFNLKASSALIRPAADLALDTEEEK